MLMKLSRWFDDTLLTIQSKLNDLAIMSVTQTMWAEAEDRAGARARMRSWRACPSWLNTFLCLWQLIIYQFGEAGQCPFLRGGRKAPYERHYFTLDVKSQGNFYFLLFFLAYFLERLGNVQHKTDHYWQGTTLPPRSSRQGVANHHCTTTATTLGSLLPFSKIMWTSFCPGGWIRPMLFYFVNSDSEAVSIIAWHLKLDENVKGGLKTGLYLDSSLWKGGSGQ